jgi:hypothetical protein
LFNWGENSYSELFRPTGFASQFGLGYYFRCYNQTGNCLGTKDGDLFYYDIATGQFSNLGTVVRFIGQIGTSYGRLIPRFVRTDFIDRDKVSQISRFRSSAGHDFSEATGGDNTSPEAESCRSMKHYFVAKSGIDPTTVNIYSPINGTIVRLKQESPGVQISIQSSDYSDYIFRIFHVNATSGIATDVHVTAGQVLGTLIGGYGGTDIAVQIPIATSGHPTFISYFDVMSDSLFSAYMARGISTRSTAIISRAERDANPLTCVNAGAFTSTDGLPAWGNLNSTSQYLSVRSR